MAHPNRNLQRERVMASLYTEGQTLHEIGQAFGVTRERVRQILRRIGVAPSAGGRAKTAEMRRRERRQQRIIERDARTQEAYGCYHDEAVALNRGLCLSDNNGFAKRYIVQRKNANKRGIEWCLTFPEWMAVWEESGHLEERGRYRDSYVMGRRNDRGPYEIGNVYITTQADNAADYQADLKRRGQMCDDGYRRLPERAVDFTRQEASNANP